MSFSNILKKLFKLQGQGPELNNEIVSKDITIQEWSITHDYLAGSLVKTSGGGAYIQSALPRRLQVLQPI